MQAMNELRNATLAARQVDPAIGSSVRNGLLRVERTTYAKNGVSTVEPVSGWLSLPDVIDFMRDIATVA
jgi:hypothetical protein